MFCDPCVFQLLSHMSAIPITPGVFHFLSLALLYILCLYDFSYVHGLSCPNVQVLYPSMSPIPQGSFAATSAFWFPVKNIIPTLSFVFPVSVCTLSPNHTRIMTKKWSKCIQFDVCTLVHCSLYELKLTWFSLKTNKNIYKEKQCLCAPLKMYFETLFDWYSRKLPFVLSLGANSKLKQ